MSVEAWHFLPDDGRLRFGNRQKVVVGETLSISERPILCERGFHASRSARDALSYAPGGLLCRVSVGGEIIEDDNKLVGQERTVIWMRDATNMLRAFAREQALSVSHLWDAPQVVHEYLIGGNESIRRDARAAAWDAALAAAWDAAWDAARAAAWAAARDAARDAAWDAAWDAARGASLGAARASVQAAARGASLGAARASVQASSMDGSVNAAWYAALTASLDAARWRFEDLCLAMEHAA
jgi:hypothetical protein